MHRAGTVLVLLLLAGLTVPASAQQVGHIAGRVLDAETGEPVDGVAVRIAGLETATDLRGRFRIEAVRPGQYTLRFSHVGYGEQTETVDVTEGEVAVVTVRLTPRAIPLDSIEVTAGEALRAEAQRRGTAVRLLTESQLDSLATETSGMGEIVRRLSGVMVQTAGYLGAPVCVEAMNRSTHTGGCDMVTLVVDGLIYTGGDAQDMLGSISPSDVARVEFLGAAEAGVRYGRDAGNGVLMIRTKQGQAASGDRTPRPTVMALDAGVTRGRIIMGGVLGATVGYLGGALAGAATTPDDFFAGASLGAVIGSTVTAPVGVHLGSQGLGRLGTKLLASGVLGGLGVAGMEYTDVDLAFAILVPAAQVALTSWLELRLFAR